MDLRKYYRRLRETEQELKDEFVVVKSLATPDGGVAGRLAEVTRAVAARMLVDGVVELASAAETQAYRKRLAEEKEQEDEKRAAAQIQLTVLSGPGLRALRRAGRGSVKD